MIELHDQLPLAALSDPRTLFEVGLIIVLAAAAPLIAQVLRVPSILLLWWRRLRPPAAEGTT